MVSDFSRSACVCGNTLVKFLKSQNSFEIGGTFAIVDCIRKCLIWLVEN